MLSEGDRLAARVRPLVNDLEHRARHTIGAEDAKALLLGWLKDIGYEQHLQQDLN